MRIIFRICHAEIFKIFLGHDFGNPFQLLQSGAELGDQIFSARWIENVHQRSATLANKVDRAVGR